MTDRLLRVDMHLHTHHSHDCLNPLGAMLEAARERRLDRLVVTDHNLISGALELQRLDPERIIIGEEVKTREGADIIGIFIKELIPKGTPAREAAMRIREQGGVVYVPHPLDGSRSGSEHLLDELEDLIDVVEVHNARCFPSSLNARALARASARGKLAGAGSDAHTIAELGRGVVELPEFENNRESFLSSLARGRVTSDCVSSSPLVRLASTWAKIRKVAGPAPPGVSESREGHEPIDLASVFLGPKGENADVFEQLLLDSLRDHVSWRRNFHPEDGFLVGDLEKHRPGYQQSIEILRHELTGLLSELKAGVPSFSPRYIGHMCPDPTMASLVGYFATMLYNPNNVAAETSPVTTRMELEVGDQLAALIGFPADRHWGHLTSGGTVANFEALWVARNVKYLPVAIHWAAAQARLDPSVRLADGSSAELSGLGLWELLNIPPESALDLADEFRKQVGDPAEAVELLSRHSLAGLGYQQFGGRLATEFRDSFPPAVVLAPSTAHYSWEKICRALGIGGSNLLRVPVDSRFRMDLLALEEILERLSAERRPVMACVTVIGTTEESAVDQLERVVELREKAAREWGLAFHLHADAAYGGYAAAVTRGPGGRRRSFTATRDAFAPEEWPERGVYDALCALESTDSVTVDPHKLGFVPYPAGAITMRDRRARDLVAVEAPYVFHRGVSEWGYIGRYIFEGSKPGAAAAAVWMSHKVLPLDADGYGHLIGQTAKGARRLHRRLGSGEWGGFRVVLLPPPDLNIVCFTVGHSRLASLEETNQFVDRLYLALRIGEEPGAPVPDYLVTKTVLRAGEYGEAVAPLVASLGFEVVDYQRAGGLSVIRCTVMDPFMVEPRGKRDHIEEFASTLQRTMNAVLEERS